MLDNGIDLSQGFTDLELKVLIEETLSPLEAEVKRDEREARNRESECPTSGRVF